MDCCGPLTVAVRGKDEHGMLQVGRRLGGYGGRGPEVGRLRTLPELALQLMAQFEAARGQAVVNRGSPMKSITRLFFFFCQSLRKKPRVIRTSGLFQAVGG